jgi:hypothetical protein
LSETKAHGRGYSRILYPDGEVAMVHDQEGRALRQEVRYEETPNGWQKTTITSEEKPEYLGSHVVKDK